MATIHLISEKSGKTLTLLPNSCLLFEHLSGVIGEESGSDSGTCFYETLTL